MNLNTEPPKSYESGDITLQTIITKLEIQRRISQLSAEIASDFPAGELTIVSVLKGAFMFSADLMRRLYDHGINPEMDFFKVMSYGSETKSSGELDILLEPTIDIKGKSVLLVDDIVDSGRTLLSISNLLRDKYPANLRTCVLLDKNDRREVDIIPDYVGFEIPDVFVVGYGLDFTERYRYLPYISAVNPTS